MEHGVSSPLAGVRVIDLGNRASTAWCGRLLADYGADLIGCESKPHPLRAIAPFDEAGDSIVARYLLASRKVCTDIDKSLLDGAKIILVSDGPSAMELSHQYPQALICVLTPWGMNDPRAGNDLSACAAGGWAFVNGLQQRAPLKSSGWQASYQAGTFACGVMVAALIEQLAHQRSGQIIDIAERDVLVSTASPAPLRWQYSGFVWSRRNGIDMNEGPVPVKDGWFSLTISRPVFWRKAMHLLGLPDLAEDEELQQAGLRPKLKDRFVERVEAAMANWKRMDLFAALGAERVIAGPVLTMNELADNPQFTVRNFFRPAEDGVIYPGPFARFSNLVWRTPFYQNIPTNIDSSPTPPRVEVDPVRAHPEADSAESAEKNGPLSGFRGLVLTQAWAGTYATQLLGLLGADVIQLETRGRLDSWRGTYQNPIPKNLCDLTSAEHSWNLSPLYNSVNLNKRCITVDLSEPEGVSLFRQLVEHADFVAENFSPRVMGNLGLDYDTLCSIKSDIVMASLSAYGATGPWAPVPGIGGTIEPSSGMSALLGYEGEHPMNSGQMYPDPVAGLCGFVAIALALLHRDRTGVGQYIDLSMQEANFTFIGDAWMEYTRTGIVRGPLGNTHPLHAPHGIYPCQGDDQWIAIAVETEEAWLACASKLNLASIAAYDLAERKIHETAINDAIALATAQWDKTSLAEVLSAAGIIASPVFGPDEIANDRALRERGVMVRVEHAEAGSHWQAGLPATLSRTPGGVRRAAPLQGEHSFEVFQEFLNMDAETYDQLCRAGITGAGPSGKASIKNQA